MKFDILIIRLAFILLLAMLGFLLIPLGETSYLAGWSSESRRVYSALLGSVIALSIIGFEMRARVASLKTLIGAAVGSILGIVGAFLIGVLISIQKEAAVSAGMQTFLTISLAFFMGYIG